MKILTAEPEVTRKNNLMIIAGKIEDLDMEMQTAIDKGEFETARKLAEEQERLLEHLLLMQRRS